MFLLYPFCMPTDTTDMQENGLRNMQCKNKKNFHIYQSTVNLGFFNISSKLSTVYCFIVPWNLWFLSILHVFLKQDRLPKIPLRLWWEHLSFCMHWERHLLWFLRYLDICIFSLQDLQCIWKATKLFFAETRCFYMRNTVCVV